MSGIIWESRVMADWFADLFDDERQNMIDELDKAVEQIVTGYLDSAGYTRSGAERA